MMDNPVPRKIRSIAWFRRATLIPSAIFFIVDLLVQRWWLAGANLGIVLVLGSVGEIIYRRAIHEYRRAARNRNYSGASAGPVAVARSARTFAAFNPGHTSTGLGSEALFLRQGLRHRREDIPIIAYKMADLAVSGDLGPHLRSHFSGAPYGHSDWAVCRALTAAGGPGSQVGWSAEHTPPRVDCSCGFYAVKTFAMVEQAYGATLGAALLEVELFGDVIVCEFGYRAERQRILHVGISPDCFFRQYTIRQYTNCADSEFVVATAHGKSFDYLLPICAEHYQRLQSITVDPGPLGTFNIEVTWNGPAIFQATLPLKTYSFEELSKELHAPVGHARVR